MRNVLVGLLALTLVGLAGCASKEQTSLKIYVQQKLYDKAIAQGGQALQKTPNSGDTHYFMGAAYFGKDADLKPEAEGYADSSAEYLAKAYQHFTKAKEFAPGPWGKSSDENIVAMYGRHFNRAVIAGKKKEYDVAALEYRLATIADPENYEAYYNHAASLAPLASEAKKAGDDAKFNEMSEAILKDLDQVIAKNPTKKEQLVSAHQSKGEILYQRGDQKGAQESYKKAIELDPENYELLTTVAERYYNAEDWENAANYFEQSLAIQERLNLIEDSDKDTYLAVGTAYLKSGKRDEAIAAYDKALKLKPNDPDIMYAIMVAHYKGGEEAEKANRMDEAKDRCNKCIAVGNDLIRIDSGRMQAWQVRGYCKRIVGDTAGAAIDLKKFNELRTAGASSK
jgi:tetratricopeptide (TPR) repeat protein